MKDVTTIDQYIADFPESVQAILKEYRKVIKETAPKSTESINYGIPSFKLKGKYLVHFGGFKKHTSLFPGSEAVDIFKKDLKDYATSKGTIKIPLDKPIPFGLIKKIVKFRVKSINESR